MNAKIEIKELASTDVAYITCIGVDGLDTAFEKMLQWARRSQLTTLPDFKLVRIFHDSFRITDHDKVRMSIGVPLPRPTAVSGEVGLTKIEKGKFIVAHFVIDEDDFGKSWESLFVWMNENGYKKATGDPFEFLHNDFKDHPERKCIVDMCIPVE
jgi:AraC family transcriptional regulator